MKGMKRTCRAGRGHGGDDRQAKMTLMGWVQKSRNKGGIIFVDLRDRSGIMQLIFDSAKTDQECL
jgi:aspartyl-tRNA synthetase